MSHDSDSAVFKTSRLHVMSHTEILMWVQINQIKVKVNPFSLGAQFTCLSMMPSAPTPGEKEKASPMP
jgi:hypothetical protein